MSLKIKNGISYDKNGWKYISVKGSPKERGYAYGFLCANEFKEIQKMLEFLMMETFGMPWDYFIKEINDDFKEMTEKEFKEYYEEMEGIADGCNAGGCKTNIDEIIAWNFYMSIPYWYSTKSQNRIGKEGGSRDRCSAFMAVGDWTHDGKIVCGHNSFVDYIDGQHMNIILDLNPDDGHRFLMQTSPCCIWSGTDIFITAKGIIGTETTFGGFHPYEKRFPIGYRIRKAMQYGNTLDEYCEILLHENSGDYANSWLFGDINTNEILRIELGLKYHNTQRTKNGYFIGFNAPYDEKIRNLEVNNSGFYDIRRHQGARKVRLADLMDEYKGKINIDVAKKIIADHYDVYLEKDNNPCSRTVCSHYDLDAREYMSDPSRPKPFAPHGAIDGFVCDSTMAKNMTIDMRWGNSCGTPFKASEYFKKHRQFENFAPYIKDRPSEPWTEFTTDDSYSKGNSKSKGKNKFRLTKKGKKGKKIQDKNKTMKHVDDHEKSEELEEKE